MSARINALIVALALNTTAPYESTWSNFQRLGVGWDVVLAGDGARKKEMSCAATPASRADWNREVRTRRRYVTGRVA